MARGHAHFGHTRTKTDMPHRTTSSLSPVQSPRLSSPPLSLSSPLPTPLFLLPSPNPSLLSALPHSPALCYLSDPHVGLIYTPSSSYNLREVEGETGTKGRESGDKQRDGADREGKKTQGRRRPRRGKLSHFLRPDAHPPPLPFPPVTRCWWAKRARQ